MSIKHTYSVPYHFTRRLTVVLMLRERSDVFRSRKPSLLLLHYLYPLFVSYVFTEKYQNYIHIYSSGNMTVRLRPSRDRSDYCVFSGLASVWGLTRPKCTNETRRGERRRERTIFSRHNILVLQHERRYKRSQPVDPSCVRCFIHNLGNQKSFAKIAKFAKNPRK